MDEAGAEIVILLANLAVLAVIGGAIAVWATILRRVVQRRPLVAFEPRRLVPWNGLDVMLILLGYLLLGASLALAAHATLGWDIHRPAANRSAPLPLDLHGPAPSPAGEKAAPEDGDEGGIDLERRIRSSFC